MFKIRKKQNTIIHWIDQWFIIFFFVEKICVNMRKKAPKDSTTTWTIHPNNFYLFYWIQQVKYHSKHWCIISWPPTSCEEAKSLTDNLSTSEKPYRHLVKKLKALPTSCEQAQSLTDILSTSEKPYRHLVNKRKALPTSCQQGKSLTDILSTCQKPYRHLNINLTWLT